MTGTDAVEDRATKIKDFVGRGWVTVLDADDEPTDAAEEYAEYYGGGRFRTWRVGGVAFEYLPEDMRAPLVVREEGTQPSKVELRPSDSSGEGAEVTEEYRIWGVGLVLDLAFRHPEKASLRFKVVPDL